MEDQETLENKAFADNREVVAAVAELDSRGQRKLGQLLAKTAQAMQEGEGGVELVTTRTITGICKSDVSQANAASGRVMRAALEIAGVSPSHLANVLREGLACRKHVIIKGLQRKLPDYALRLKYLELAHRLRGDMQAAEQATETMTYEQRLRQVIDNTSK